MAVPNHPPSSYDPVYFGPGPGLPGPCDDRDNHTYPPGISCTSLVPGSVNAPLIAGAVRLPYGQNPCTNTTTRHGPGHTVCYHCNHMNENLHWYKLAFARIVRQPPAPANETTQWRGFLTRMCVLCEQREQYLIAARRPAGVARVLALAPTAAERIWMEDYPFNTCTCRKNLDRGRRCRDHRKDHWDDLRTQLVQQRNANKRWLFETAEHNGLLTANDARRFNRTSLAPGFGLRGCRCGREVTTAAPVMWQCMACEGIIEVTGTEMTNIMVMANPPNAQQQINSASLGAPLAMGQPRSAQTW